MKDPESFMTEPESRIVIEPRIKIVTLFTELGIDLLEQKGLDYSVHDDHHVNAFYRLLPKPGQEYQAVHIQGFPWFSDNNEAHVCARLIDTRKTNILIAKERDSIGIDHPATVLEFDYFMEGKLIPYDSKQLREALADYVLDFKP